MASIEIELYFEGSATIFVPDEVPEDLRRSLAKSVALARVLATFENDDCDNCLMLAEDEFVKVAAAAGISEERAEKLFDQTRPEGEPGGNWTSYILAEE